MPGRSEHIPFSDMVFVNPRTDTGGLGPNELVSFIPMADVSDSGEWTTRQARPLKDVSTGYTPFMEGDVLFAKITPCMENGKGAHAVGLVNGRGFGSTEFHVLRPKPGYDGRFIFHWTQSRLLRTRAEAFMTGSAGQQRVESKFFKYFRVARMSIEQQRRIAEILDTIDEAIRRTEQVITKLGQMKQGLAHNLLTRGIDKNGELRDPKKQPDAFADAPLGTVPRGWEVLPLGQIVYRSGGFIQTGPFGSQLHAHDYVTHGIPVIMPQDMVEGTVSDTSIAHVTEKKARELSRHLTRVNDLVLARRGDVSRCAPIGPPHQNWLCGTGSMLVRVPANEFDSRWLAEMYRHERSQRQITARAVGSTMVNLNSKILAGLLVARPPLEEQKAHMEILESVACRLRIEKSQLAKLRQLKHGLMDDLLMGRVRVTVPAGSEATVG